MGEMTMMGPGWVMIAVGVALWTLVALALIWLVRTALDSGRDRGRDGGSARELLDQRFARGEIDAEEYRERRAVLDRP